MLETNAGGQTVADQRYYGYGRQRDTGPVTTDYRFTGQQHDGSGLVYMNARYYDPALGQFISPDTLVPDPGLLIDYNRYGYARGNPLKYTDPSGRCAVLGNGEPDMEGDGECWQVAYQIYGLSTRDAFARDWRMTGDEWLEKIATAKFADVEYLTPFADSYYAEWAREVGLPVDKVVWHPVVNRPVRAPGQDLVEIVAVDIGRCYADWRQCGRALDDASVALSTVAVGCGVTGIAPCAGVASVAGTTVDVIGMGLTGYEWIAGEASATDVTVAGATTLIGGSRIGAKPNGTNLVGWVASIFQWIWDH